MKNFLDVIHWKQERQRKSFKNSKIWLFVLVFILSLVPQSFYAAEKTTTSVVLHKIVYQENKLPAEGIANAGKEVSQDFLLGGRPLSGAEFSIFEVTTQFYALTEGTSALKPVEAQTKIAEEGKTAKENNQLKDKFGEPIAVGTTNAEGLATFDLENLSVGGKGRVYLIIETKVPEIIQTAAQNIVLTLPLVEADGNDWTQPVHLYPKNVEHVCDPYFYKHGRDESGKDTGALAEANFRLYKLIDNEKYYLHEMPYSNGNTWVKESDAGIAEFSSDKEGKVTIGEHHLPTGTYYFEETKAPAGYTITETAKKIEVNVPASVNESVTITLENQNVLMNEAIVYNDRLPESPKTPGEPKTPQMVETSPTPESSRKSLPSTGEMISKVLPIAGLLIILVGAALYKRKSGGEANEQK